MTATEIDRYIGELAAKQEMILQKLQQTDAKIDELTNSIQELKIAKAKDEGGRKAIGVIAAFIGSAIGAVTAILTVLITYGGH